MDKLNIGLVSLGCDKNRVDSEIILGLLSKNCLIVKNPNEADIIIVNTCGFIESSKQESVDTILEMAEFKKNRCKVLVVTGCLTQRYGEELQELLPEVDVMLGVNDYDKLEQSINDVLLNKNKICMCNYSDTVINEGDRILTTPKHYAYLRIGEGCSNFCSYCAIPKIRGRYRSRKMEEVLKEANTLAEKGVKEIILVAQDTTKYGIDLYGKKMLAHLIREISKIEEIKWIRILYCYPEELTEELIDEIASNDKVCKYLDIPIQHISNNVLKAMRRRGKKEEIINAIKMLRDKVENICLRTSIIVGFPGETNEDFNELKDFIKEYSFDKLGVFKYSQEENTPAADFENQIDENVKVQREEEIMVLQQQISEEINKNKINKVYKVIVDGFNDDYFIGRSYEMTPEVDGVVYFKSDKSLNKGDIVPVRINENLKYDLIGVVCDEFSK